MNKSTAFFSCISMYMYKFPWHLCVQRCYILFTLHSLHTDVHKDAVFSSNFHVQDHCHTGHISKSLHISTHKKRHCILFLLCCMTLHSLLTLLYDTAFSSNFHVKRHCILFLLSSTTLHFLQTAFSSLSGVQGVQSCIFFKLPCTKTLHSLLTLGVKHQVIYSPFLCETLHSLHMSMSKDTAFSSHVHVQRHCTLFTCPRTKTLHSLHTSMNKDTALSSHVHGHQNSLTRSFTV